MFIAVNRTIMGTLIYFILFKFVGEKKNVSYSISLAGCLQQTLDFIKILFLELQSIELFQNPAI